jgi:hypothetical protein
MRIVHLLFGGIARFCRLVALAVVNIHWMKDFYRTKKITTRREFIKTFCGAANQILLKCIIKKLANKEKTSEEEILISITQKEHSSPHFRAKSPG